jgi:hypothetical protein
MVAILPTMDRVAPTHPYLDPPLQHLTSLDFSISSTVAAESLNKLARPIWTTNRTRLSVRDQKYLHSKA